MTVRELIERLEKLDGSLRVMVRGYEGGYHDVEDIEGPNEYCLNVMNEVWYYGPHEKTGSIHDRYGCDHERAVGVLL